MGLCLSRLWNLSRNTNWTSVICSCELDAAVNRFVWSTSHLAKTFKMLTSLNGSLSPLCLLVVISVLCQVVCGRGIEGSEKELYEISVIHINDFHARFEQTSPSSGVCPEGQEETCVGGIARIATVVKSLVKERPNPVFLNAGDNFQGTLWYTKFKWNVTAQFMNMLPHDALVSISLYVQNATCTLCSVVVTLITNSFCTYLCTYYISPANSNLFTGYSFPCRAF